MSKLNLKGRLVLVGAGKMGSAMLEGWLKNGLDPARTVIFDPAAQNLPAGVTINPDAESITDAEVVIIAVKPQVMQDVLPGIACLKKSNPLIISVAAGKTIASFAEHFGQDAAIIRTMPNTPAAVGRGITAMAAKQNVTAEQKALAEALLSAIGEVVSVDNEQMIDAVTAVSGSGPAYVFYVTECMAKAGEKLGLSPELSMQLARATVSGAGELMRQSGIEAATLRENVTSPKGTTYAALQVLMAENGLQPIFDRALKAAADRSRELAS